VKFSPNWPYTKSFPAQLALPVPVRFDLVDEHGTVLTAVSRQIALSIAVQVEPIDPAATGDGVLEHAGEDRSPLPLNVFRNADVD
jgi:hypothetical protein